MDVIDHEFRTPLNVILGFASLLSDGAYGPLSPEALDAVEHMAASARRLTELLEDLQLHAQLMKGPGSMQVDEIAAEELAQAIEAEFSPKFASLKQQLEIQLPDPAPRIRSDPCRLYTALRHLMANAHKFTPAGGRVVLRIETLREGWRLSIVDNGIGIPREAWHRVFEGFYQVDSSASRLRGGMGLGLAIVKAMVESLGGRIQLQSAPGNGSRFEITLPAQPPVTHKSS